jgi:hypothetical protein
LEVGLIVVRQRCLRDPVAELARAPDSSQTAAGIFELRLKSPMDLVKRDVFLAEKSKNHSLLVVPAR